MCEEHNDDKMGSLEAMPKECGKSFKQEDGKICGELGDGCGRGDGGGSGGWTSVDKKTTLGQFSCWQQRK
jgi:hypothetical protein